MEKNKKIIWGVVGIIILAVVFYGGMVYGKSQIPARGNQAFSQFGQNGLSNARGTRNSGGFANGQIIAKDTNSITVGLMGGGATASAAQSGSKIIFFDSNTKVTKSVDGTTADLNTGEQVAITGTPNSDGSLTATSVQIRPTPAGAVVK